MARRLTVDIRLDAAPPWQEGKHPRGQPENKGEFTSKGGGITGGASAKAPEKSATTPRLMKPERVAGKSEFGGTTFVVYVNPPASQVMTLARSIPFFRAATYPSGDVVLADGDKALHPDLTTNLVDAAHPLAEQERKDWEILVSDEPSSRIPSAPLPLIGKYVRAMTSEGKSWPNPADWPLGLKRAFGVKE